jgi:hypothetical protein
MLTYSYDLNSIMFFSFVLLFILVLMYSVMNTTQYDTLRAFNHGEPNIFNLPFVQDQFSFVEGLQNTTIKVGDISLDPVPMHFTKHLHAEIDDQNQDTSLNNIILKDNNSEAFDPTFNTSLFEGKKNEANGVYTPESIKKDIEYFNNVSHILKNYERLNMSNRDNKLLVR